MARRLTVISKTGEIDFATVRARSDFKGRPCAATSVGLYETHGPGAEGLLGLRRCFIGRGQELVRLAEGGPQFGQAAGALDGGRGTSSFSQVLQYVTKGVPNQGLRARGV